MLVFDPSRPYQLTDELLAIWLPRGRKRDAAAHGLVAAYSTCQNPACACTDARLQAFRIDDRAENATCLNDKLQLNWRGSAAPLRKEGPVRLKVDIVTGVVEADGGKEQLESVAEYFREPLPFWVLDALWARWSAPRTSLCADWKVQALDLWEPGELLSTAYVFPDDRPDRYVLDGNLYQADTLFCVDPDCPCTEGRLSMLAVSANGRELVEVASARLTLEVMIPDQFFGERNHRETLTRLYLEWRRRHAPAEARFRELRDTTRRRGLELHEALLARSKPRALVPSVHGAPGRNAQCPCGSGKKFKRCCAG